MKPKTMILMVLAIVCGLVASYMTSQLIAQNKEEVVVLKAKKKLSQWYTIREADLAPGVLFEAASIPKKTARQNFIGADKIAELKGRRLRANIDEGIAITEDDLLKRDVAGIDSMLPPGKKAMAITISAQSAVGFFVVPGSQVDVIHTVGGVSTLLLEDVLVLAIDLSTGRQEDKPGMAGGTATLQLDNGEQVLKLSGARDRGSLSLVMRSSGDDGKKGRNEEKLAAAPTVLPPPPPPFEEVKEDTKTTGISDGTPEKPVKRIKSVDIVNGDKGARISYEFDKDGKVIDVTAKSFDDLNQERSNKAPKKDDKPALPKTEKADSES